ncbi:MAG: lysophospholipid acyltransferase family protein [Acidobacteria bacterium]|nr:lysophospholipid acyltransferase family protein [Acidobacteriota bacterium]
MKRKERAGDHGGLGAIARTLLPLLWLVEHAALLAVLGVVSLLPGRARLAFGRALGRLAFRVLPRQRRTALDNLALAYPEADSAWRRSVAEGAFAHLGRLLVEVLTMRRVGPRLAERLRIEGREHLAAVTATGTGYFLLSGHFGNWEWIALHQGALGHRLGMVIRPLDNPRLERWFAGNRTSTGNRLIAKRDALREVVRGLKAGLGIAFVIDQNFREKNVHFVPFFGRLAATTPAVGTLAVRMRVPVLPVFAYPLPDGTYRVVYEPPIEPHATGDEAADALAVTAEATRRIEAAIRRCPTAWFWMHRRWRSRPPEEGCTPAQPSRGAHPTTHPGVPSQPPAQG